MNEFKPTINLTRADICDLLLACLAAESISDGAKKWRKLHEKLKALLKELDKQLDEIREGIND